MGRAKLSLERQNKCDLEVPEGNWEGWGLEKMWKREEARGK